MSPGVTDAMRFSVYEVPTLHTRYTHTRYRINPHVLPKASAKHNA